MNNMRAMMQEQVFSSDVVIFNRTDDDTDRGHLRRTIKNSTGKHRSSMSARTERLMSARRNYRLISIRM